MNTPYLDVLAAQATREADAQAKRVQMLTGLPMFAHGKPLAEYVARRMAEGVPARQIARDAGYPRLWPFAERLARHGDAPLGRMLLERHHYETAVVR